METVTEKLERNRVLDSRKTADIIGCSVVHLRRLVKTGRFPAPIKIGLRKHGWPAGVVLDRIAKLAEAS